MDYLDRNKDIRQRIILWIGYVFVSAAIVTTALVLVYQSYGFNLGKNNTVVQNGLIFLSSHPNPADIYLNGSKQSVQTNSRLIIPSGIYKVILSRSGYQNWARTITVDGGAVEHFDYPFLIPNKLISTHLSTYDSAPGLVTQSLDRRWILIEKPGSATSFDLWDLKTPNKPVMTSFTLPNNVLTKATSSESLQLVSWANDNQHVLLEHIFDNKTEYILLDRNDPTQSVNLNSSLAINPTQLSLVNEKYNSYYAFDASSGDLDQYNLGSTTSTDVVDHVLAYKSYGNNTILYDTAYKAPKGRVLVKLKDGSNTYTIKNLPVSTTYLLDLTTYSSQLYVAAGSDTDNRVYVYADPVGQLSNYPNQSPVPTWVLHVDGANYLSFSNTAQFVMAENGRSFATYDIENSLGYLYNTGSQAMDAPQAHATWMDGDRLTYVSGGMQVIFDYDHQNDHTLAANSASYLPNFTSDYNYLYTLSPVNASTQFTINQTSLLIPSDQ